MEKTKNQRGKLEYFYSRFLDSYYLPGYDFNLNIIRVLVSSFFIWKLLSRDYGFYGSLPENIFSFYPISIYPPHSIILLTGLPILTDILTFHWIHWFLPRPGVEILSLIQDITIFFLFLHIFVGKGPRSLVSIICYSMLIYLWGYLFITGQDVDCIFLYFGTLLALTMSTYDDRPIWRISKLTKAQKNLNAGKAISNVFLVFVIYYFAAGVNKLTDMSLIGWFSSDIVQALEMFRIRSERGYIMVPYILEHIYDFKIFNVIGPPLVYLSHLVVPMVFFFRNQVFSYAIFYALFHFLVFGVGISFTGYLFVWALLFPYHILLRKNNGY